MTPGDDTESPVIRVGLAGLEGDILTLLPTFLTDPRLIITAVADIDEDAAQVLTKRAPVKLFGSVEDLCKSPDVDVVAIATANRFRTEHGLMAVAHGKHLIVDKLLALTLEGADRVIETAEQAGAYVLVYEPVGCDAATSTVREIVRGEELGKLRMMHSLFFNDWLYRPRTEEELTPVPGEGLVFRQGCHQLDSLRVIGGGLVQSVRAATAVWDDNRPIVGGYAAYLGFEGGVGATAVYNSYDRFHTIDLALRHSERGQTRSPREYARARKALGGARNPGEEAALKRPQSQALSAALARPSSEPTGGFLLSGLTVISCDRGDILLSPEGLFVYGDKERQEVPLLAGSAGPAVLVNQLYEAVKHGRQPLFDGKWGKASLEVYLAVMESGKDGREVSLSHQKAVSLPT